MTTSKITNEILQRIYLLQPSIHAWARTGRPNILWGNLEGARMGMMQYVGPSANPLVLNSLHLHGGDRDFITSLDAMHAMWAVVGAIYNDQPLNDGYLPEEKSNASQGKEAVRRQGP